MASSAAAAAVSSGAGASGTAANGPSLAAGNKSHFKSNATAPSAAKAMDGGRRQSGSPVDGPQRRPSQKAWTQGTNPITQRNINNSLPNGTPHQARNAAKGSLVPHHDLLSADRHADDRLLYLLANCVGRKATIEAKTGEVYAGIFSCSLSETTDAFWLLKMVKRKAAGSDRRPGGTDGASSGYIGSGPEHSMYFDIKDVVELAVDGVEFGDRSTKGPNGIAHANSFRTDNDISGNQTGRERTLQRWEPSAEDDPGLALEDGNDGRGGLAGSNGTWDQFEANKRLYGITSDYDVNLYTTAIDRSDPQYKNNLARAEKIAREIEASSAMNAHVAEERGLAPAVDDSGMDEEAKYSEVRRTSKAADQPVPMSSQDGTPNRYTPPARRAPAAASSMTPALLKDPAIVSQKARQDPALPHPAETKGRNGLAQVKPMPAARDERNLAPSAGANNMRPRALPAGSRAAPAAAATAKQPASLQGPVANNLTSPRTKAPGESATTTVEHDVRDAFKQFANTEKMRLQEHRRNQAKHDKDIKLNDLMKFSQNFKLTTPVPKDLVPILAKDKTKQEEIVQRAQRNVESSRVIPGSGKKPIATGADAKVQVKPSAADTAAATAAATKKVAAATTTTTTTTTSAGAPMTRPEGGARQAQLTMPDRQPPGRGRPGQSGHGGVGGHQGRPPPAPPNAGMPPGRAGPGLSQRLTNFQQMNRGSAAQMHVPPPLPIHDHRGPPAGPVGGGVPEPHRYGGAPTPTSATSSRFNVSAIEFKPAGIAFAPTAEPSAASSPRSNVNAGTPSRAATPSGFFGAKRPLPASERRPILEHFNPLRRLRQEAEQNKEEWPSNGGIKPAHKTGPRWEVADTNREKTYAEMFEKVPFSTQSVSPQHPSYAAPHLPHQHQLPFHLQHGGPVVPQPPTAHQVPHHLHSQQQQHHQHHQHQQQQQQHHHHHHHHHHQQQQHQHQQHPHHHHHPHPHPHHPHPPVGVPHHFDDHRMHVSSSPSVLPSPRLQPVHMAYQSPMGPHAQIVYGQPMPQYAMAPAGPPMAPLRQYPAGSHFVHQHGAHVAPMMTHSPSGGHMAAGIPQGVGAPYGQPMPVYSPNPVQAYMHPGGPPPPQPGSSGYPSPGRAAPMMIHQGSQPGQPPHQMMMFGMSPGQQSQHLYVSHPPVQGPGPRGGNYPPPQQPHYTAMPPAHHVSAHHRGGPTYGHQPPPPPHVAHVATQPAASGPGHGGGHDDEDLK